MSDVRISGKGKNRTILLLGGSRQQVPVIEKAKEAGYRTVLIDYLPDNPGKEIADKWYSESTTDIEAVFRIAKKEKVGGILAYASDPAALPAAIVCERLGLPTNPVKSVEILGVKHKFREFLQENRFACPRNYSFTDETPYADIESNVNKLTFPIVVKPTDSSGSKGVSFINEWQEFEKARAHALEYSRNGILIAEEFIQRGFPDVIGGDIFVENGKIVLYGDMGCLRGDEGRSLLPIGKKRPNGLNLLQKSNLHTELDRLIQLLGIQFGELNIEVIIDKDDKPHFLEVGPRAGGNMIPVELSDAFSVDLPMANVKAAMGDPVNLEPQEPEEAFMTYVLHSKKDGIFESVQISREIEPYVYRKVIYKRPGDKVEAFDGAGKAIGIIFMHFPDAMTMNGFAKDIERLMKTKLA